ncbi:MAG: hypothetical protein ACM3XM_00070 [Mycobacterium leprae]
MCLFTPVQTGQPDPWKRVRYFEGLVLEVDEFEQEAAYYTERMKLQNHGLHGYGTVVGLHVDPKGTSVMVNPGLAIDPLGREIHVSEAQCADVGEWLKLQKLDPNAAHTLYVTLAYHACDSDPVPVPSQPCKSGDSLENSRVTECFTLAFVSEAPHQPEEQDVIKFREKLAADLCTLPAAEHPDKIRAAYRDWVLTQRAKAHPANAEPENTALLLAKISWTPGKAVTVDEKSRPFLLPTRLIQEELMQGMPLFWGESAAGDLSGTYPAPTVKALQGTAVSANKPTDQDVLTFNKDHWEPHALPAPLPDPYGLHGYGTVLGLRLAVDGTKVVVKPGLAVDPWGRQMPVPEEQSVDVAEWLTKIGLDPAKPQKAYVTLSYRDEERARVTLHKTAPAQPEEQAVVKFREYLTKQLCTTPGVLKPEKIRELYHEWVTEIRVKERPATQTAENSALLLGQVNWTPSKPMAVMEEGRPLLLTTRQIQEELMQGMPLFWGESAGGDLKGTYPGPTLKSLQGTPLDVSKAVEKDVLTYVKQSDGTFRWEPHAPQAAGAPEPTPDLPVARFMLVTCVDAPATYELWLDPDGAGLPKSGNFEVNVWGMMADGTELGHQITAKPETAPNCFSVTLDEDLAKATYLRFTANLDAILCDGNIRAAEWSAQKGQAWVGGISDNRLTVGYRPLAPAAPTPPTPTVWTATIYSNGEVTSDTKFTVTTAKDATGKVIPGQFWVSWEGYDSAGQYDVTGTVYKGSSPTTDVFKVTDQGSRGLLIEVYASQLEWTTIQVKITKVQ